MEAFYFILAQTKGNCALESQFKNELTLISNLQYDNHFPMKEKARIWILLPVLFPDNFFVCYFHTVPISLLYCSQCWSISMNFTVLLLVCFSLAFYYNSWKKTRNLRNCFAELIVINYYVINYYIITEVINYHFQGLLFTLMSMHWYVGILQQTGKGL